MVDPPVILPPPPPVFQSPGPGDADGVSSTGSGDGAASGDAPGDCDGEVDFVAVTEGDSEMVGEVEGVADRDLDGDGVGDMGAGEYAPGARLEPADSVYTMLGRRAIAAVPSK